MMRRLFLLGLLLAVFHSRGEAEPRTVVLVSLDGFAANYLDDRDLKAFARLKREGAFAEKLIPVFPSLTFPNHVSLATGCSVSKHGIVGNRFLDKERGEYDYSVDPEWSACEPLWIAAERQGVRASVHQWALSFGRWKDREATYHEASFNFDRTDAMAFQEILEDLQLPIEKRPRLIMAYFRAVDAVGHRYGPRSPERQKRTRQLDRQLGSFLTKLEKIRKSSNLTLIVVSDHGMIDAHGTLVVDELVAGRKLGAMYKVEGPALFFYAWNPQHVETIERIFSSLPGVHLYSARDLPATFGAWSPRMGDLMAVADPPAFFTVSKNKKGETNGMHGYDPTIPEMAGIFFAWGDGVGAEVKISSLSAKDVAPVAARLLEIAPPAQSEGVVPESIFQK